MYTRLFFRQFLVVFVVVAFFAQPVLACVVSRGQDFRQLLGADIIVVGSVRSYTFLDVETYGRGPYYAELQVRVVDRIYGGGFGELRFVVEEFSAKTLDAFLPDRATGDWPKFMFALKNVKTDRRLQSSGRDPLQLTLMNEPCAGAYMFDADSPVVEAAKFIFRDDVDRFNEANVMARFLRMEGGDGLY